MKPKSVKIEGTELEDVSDVQFRAHKPSTEHGFPSGQTGAVEVVFTKTGTRVPTPQGFELATNGDGKVKIFSAEIQLQNAEHETTYTVKLVDAFIERWQLVSPEYRKGKGDPPVMEVWVIQAGRVETTAGKETAKFELETFPKKK